MQIVLPQQQAAALTVTFRFEVVLLPRTADSPKYLKHNSQRRAERSCAELCTDRRGWV
jgi:hypothetical protein